MNRYKIFQVYFQENQLREINHLLTPFDNTENLKPELREYHCFKKLIEDKHTENLDAWGLFGPRWKEKLRYDASQLFSAIEQNPHHDVWIFNHARVQHALTVNVWEQGEYYHKGIREVVSYALNHIGYSDFDFNKIMTDEITCYCSYFVAKRHFWDGYLNFLDQIFLVLNDKNLPESIKKLYNQSANYSRDKTLNMFPFIMERLFSSFLSMYEYRYSVYSKPYDYKVYSKELGNLTEVFDCMNNLKTIASRNNSSEVFIQWQKLRGYYLNSFPQLMNLD